MCQDSQPAKGVVFTKFTIGINRKPCSRDAVKAIAAGNKITAELTLGTVMLIGNNRCVAFKSGYLCCFRLEIYLNALVETCFYEILDDFLLAIYSYTTSPSKLIKWNTNSFFIKTQVHTVMFQPFFIKPVRNTEFIE